jgi:hypothetical protein
LKTKGFFVEQEGKTTVTICAAHRDDSHHIGRTVESPFEILGDLLISGTGGRVARRGTARRGGKSLE